MTEVMKREIKAEKIDIRKLLGLDEIETVDVQVALNDWGHLTVRYFKRNDQNNDVVIVFDMVATNRIIRFVKTFLAK